MDNIPLSLALSVSIISAIDTWIVQRIKLALFLEMKCHLESRSQGRRGEREMSVCFIFRERKGRETVKDGKKEKGEREKRK